MALSLALAGFAACSAEEERRGPSSQVASSTSTGKGGAGGATTTSAGGNGGAGATGGFGGSGGAAQNCEGIYDGRCGTCIELLCCAELSDCKAHAGCIECLNDNVCQDAETQDLAATTLACVEQLCQDQCFEPGSGGSGGQGGQGGQGQGGQGGQFGG